MAFFYNSIRNIHSNVEYGFSKNPKIAFGIYGRGYWNAASRLSKSLLRRNHFYEYDAYPAIFLYRHSLELYLKNIIYRTEIIIFYANPESILQGLLKDHKLIDLSKRVTKILSLIFPKDKEIKKLSKEIVITAEEFSNIDPYSFSFRYPMDNNGRSIPHNLINLKSIQVHMDSLLKKLDNLDGLIDLLTDSTIKKLMEEGRIEE